MNDCAWCGQPITWWRLLLRLFWAPWWCDMSVVWRECCSRGCYVNALYAEAKRRGINVEEWK